MIVRRIINVINFITKLSAMLAGLMIVALVFINTYAVFLRYILNRPVDWIVDVSELLMVAAVFLGTSYILQIEGHVRVDIILIKLSKKVRHIFNLVVFFIILLFSIILVWKSWELAMVNRYTRSSSVVMLPLFPGYLSVFCGSCLLLLQSIIKIYSNIKERPH